MVPKQKEIDTAKQERFRAVLFRMVPKPLLTRYFTSICFRAVLFRMVPKLHQEGIILSSGFRAVLFRMVPKRCSKRYI